MGRINLASENSFQLVFPKLPHQDVIDREFVLHIYQTVLPGLSFDREDRNWQGFVVPTVSGNLSFEEWTTAFDVDEEFRNWRSVFEWMKHINNNKDKAGEDFKKYIVDADMFVYDNYERLVVKALFRNLFPISLGGVTFSTREGEQYLTTEVTFAYTYFEFQ